MTNPISWLVDHVRLAIEYALIALVVILAGVAWYNYRNGVHLQAVTDSQAQQIAEASKLVSLQQTVNASQDEAIAALKELRERDAKAIDGLQSDLKGNDLKTRQFREKLKDLEANNAHAKTLLSIPVPRDVGCVLDHHPCQTGTPADPDPGHQGAAAASPATPVRGARGG